MEKVCGDGYHHPTEICDDGNTDPNDGCGADCRVESNWDCILYDPQGPDVCYQQAPPNITSYITKIHYDTLFVEFSRPLAEAINFTNFTSISILGVDDPNQVLVEPVNDEGIVVMHDKANMFIPYEYNITQIDP
jgi:cysteine-rich repeat protein